MSPSNTKQQKLKFKTEVQRLLHLMINSLYSNREVFLRELISNASDAADKLRFEALEDDGLYAGDSDLKVVIHCDPGKLQITISDNGIGMSRQEVIDNLGAIARSGTANFLESLSGDNKKDASLIGQFGVGFYSCFMVAEHVEVRTRRAGAPDEEGVVWKSDGVSDFTVRNAADIPRGASVQLSIKKEFEEFCQPTRLRAIVKKYADHIALPVLMEKLPEIPAGATPDISVSNTPEGKDSEEKSPELESVNAATALWTRSRNDIKDDEYKSFYRHITHDHEDPLTYSHNRVEGKLDYTSLLYVPSSSVTLDLWNREAARGLKLYVERTFIMDHAEQFLPLYLRFIKGVVDSSDLSLNVSREILQQDEKVMSMRSALSKRALDMLNKLAEDAPEDYARFWDSFGLVMKEGMAEEFSNREALIKLLRFATTHADKPEQRESLAAYVERMAKDQEKIYYVVGDSFEMVKNSPHLEWLRERGFEALLLYDRIDEWFISHLNEFDGKRLQDVSRGELDEAEVADSKKEKQQKAEEKGADDEPAVDDGALIARIKESLGAEVSAVRPTQRLRSSPACLVIGEQDMGEQMRRIIQTSGQKVPDSKPALEVNLQHEILRHMAALENKLEFAEWARLLLDQAQLTTGAALRDPNEYVQRVNALLMANVDSNANNNVDNGAAAGEAT